MIKLIPVLALIYAGIIIYYTAIDESVAVTYSTDIQPLNDRTAYLENEIKKLQHRVFILEAHCVNKFYLGL